MPSLAGYVWSNVLLKYVVYLETLTKGTTNLAEFSQISKIILSNTPKWFSKLEAIIISTSLIKQYKNS